MLKKIGHAIGLAIARYLMTESESQPLTAPEPFERLANILSPGDVLLVEGRTRVAQPIKYLTQSTWSHAALYVGPIAGALSTEGEPLALIEAELISGVTASPLSKYRRSHVRICRPAHLSQDDLTRLIGFATSRIGAQYDLHNIFDLLRYMAPTPPIPSRFRRRFIAAGAGSPSRAICSTLIAEAFRIIGYPVLPTIEFIEATDPRTQRHVLREILHIRDTALYTPRDFDLSPFFAVVKPELVAGFDYHHAQWAR